MPDTPKRTPPRKKRFLVNARLVLSLGRESIKDNTTAILELVKNSYDAGATVVTITLRCTNADQSKRHITIADNGSGMSESQITKHFLSIGYSNKKTSQTIGARRRTGEKGIGRLSADRLGSKLELRSQAKNKRAAGIRINWDDFDTATEISNIEIESLQSPKLQIPRKWLFSKTKDQYTPIAGAKNSTSVSGTELKISGLRQKWNKEDIDQLKADLSLLVPPFGIKTDFQIRISSDITDTIQTEVVESAVQQKSEIQGYFRLFSSGTVKYKISHTETPTPDFITTEWKDFYQPNDSSRPLAASPDVGPMRVHLLFSRQTAGVSSKSDIPIKSQAEINAASGVKLYRDGIRVMPYGDIKNPEGGDWLSLGRRKAQNPAGAGRKGYRVSPYQLVGAVLVSRDRNPELIDTSAREGLVHNEAFYQMRSFVIACISLIENTHHDLYVNNENYRKDLSPRKVLSGFRKSLTTLKKDLTTVSRSLPKERTLEVTRLTSQITSTVEQVASVDRSISELTSQAALYRSLASVGISSAVFSHETDVSLDQLCAAVNAAKILIKRAQDLSNIPTALTEMEKATTEAKKISAWGRFALHRIKPDKRRRRPINIGAVVSMLLKDLSEVFKGSTITIEKNINDVTARLFPLDIESVVLNLITNAYAFVKLPGTSTKRVIRVEVSESYHDDIPGVQIIVADSGPGVREDIKESIWKPLFTTKQDSGGKPFGTGLGLSIVDDVVADNNGVKHVSRDDKLDGAKFTIWIPLGRTK